MERDIISAAMGERPFDLAIRNVQLVNVLTEEIYPADIGIAGDTFAYVGPFKSEHSAAETIDGGGMFAVPGFIDSHMHIESSMMTPAAFAEAVVPLGTTTVAADPHEIGNVLGKAGVRMLCEMSRNLPLEVHVMAPSTIPSAPGFETSAVEIDGGDVAEMLGYPGVLGLGEVMDFNGVIAGDKKLMGIIAAAKQAGVLLDGHAPLLRGRELQAFAASGIDCDHTYMDSDIAREKLRYGMWIQIQERFLSKELMQFLAACPVQNRITLVTDDVPLTRLASQGHLNSLVRKAIALGLPAQKAIRYVTINPADRLRLYRSGAIAPGRQADMLLLSGLEEAAVEKVFVRGKLAAEGGRMLVPVAVNKFPLEAYTTMKIRPLSAADFVIPAGGAGGKNCAAINTPGAAINTPRAASALVNAIEQDGKTSRTKGVLRRCNIEKGVLVQGELVKMAVFERHTGKAGRSIALLANLEKFQGAMATTYAHDCHNLVVYSSNDDDAVLAANKVIAMGGGVSAYLAGKELCAIALPIAGILCADKLETLSKKFASLLDAAKVMQLNHAEPLTFLTLMALAVSPEIKLTDRGLLDVIHKRFIPLIEEIPGTCAEAESRGSPPEEPVQKK
ncbi:adenine deaminase [Spirochaetia bacterium]|nr:adenine deaminase [Spirochaetia bacterium]